MGLALLSSLFSHIADFSGLPDSGLSLPETSTSPPPNLHVSPSLPSISLLALRGFPTPVLMPAPMPSHVPSAWSILSQPLKWIESEVSSRPHQSLELTQ